MNTPRQIAHVEPLEPVRSHDLSAVMVEPRQRVDLRPFEPVLPLLFADVQTLYGRRSTIDLLGAGRTRQQLLPACPRAIIVTRSTRSTWESGEIVLLPE